MKQPPKKTATELIANHGILGALKIATALQEECFNEDMHDGCDYMQNVIRCIFNLSGN